MHMYTLGTIWKIREFPHPAGSTANTSFHLMKWSEASSWTGFNSWKNIGKTTIQRKLYCTTKGSLEFATIVHLFLCLKFLRAKKPVSRAPQEHSRDSANESSCYHYHSERSQTKFEHQSATKFKICTRGSEVRNCRDQRVFFLPLVTIADSPLNCCHKQQVKKGRDGAVVLSTWSVSNETENLMTNIWFKLNQRAKIP